MITIILVIKKLITKIIPFITIANDILLFYYSGRKEPSNLACLM